MTSPAGNPARKRDLAQIHIAKNDLGLDEDTYRAALWTIGRVKSAADLDFAGRRKLIEHFKSRGWKSRRSKKPRAGADPLAGKILALWLELRDRSMIQDASDAALKSFIKRQTGVEAVQWLNNRQAHLVIEALKGWLNRGADAA